MKAPYAFYAGFVLLLLSIQGTFAAHQVRAGDKEFISLKVVSEELQNLPQGAAYPPELMQLFGDNRVYGYVIDPANRDILLITKRFTEFPWKSCPPLRLEDFVAALRNTGDLYLTNNQYSPPACSIDPEASTQRQLSNISARLHHAQGAMREGLKREWMDVGKSPQNVSVLGLPFSCHFASVIVSADYKMKDIVDAGVPNASIPFTSMRQLMMASFANGQSSTGPLFNRYWFSEANVPVTTNASLVLLADFVPPLLTEEEHLGSTGGRRGTGRPNELARQVAESFTTSYELIADDYGTNLNDAAYWELENIYRWVALAEALKKYSAFNLAGFQPDWFLNNFKMPFVRVDAQLQGRPDIVTNASSSVVIYSCGGVDASVNLVWTQVDARTRKGMQTLAGVASRRPPGRTVHWPNGTDYDPESWQKISAGAFPLRDRKPTKQPPANDGILN